MTAEQPSPSQTQTHVDTTMPPADGIPVSSPVVTEGFTLPAITFVQMDGNPALTPPLPPPVQSSLASKPAIKEAELIELSAETGKLLYYPAAIAIDPGDVFYLRERSQPQTENGIIVQVIKKETATYAQVESKVIWRLLTAVRAQELQRAYHEPTEVIDLFLAATFKVRAAVVNGKWASPGGNIVTRNVDIFSIDP